ncbi:Crp/Fnr family transcriptional regulator [Hydrogenophaga sp.]|uniref:Crp/Fnr family transcriptional regulator n=1 Tax=Hydrogenophaga sp. TaxID=1904254 RepID=UPI002731AEF3|nr:helix-turn-helix domain-containing protein [Hydrogenophaga sp.]MDP2017864.1 helix-turn-helix domain-containing protein [Hydrogenophaga sp.]MDP3165180.1 helix-turn-helix domain-containing protein [Hydrogenophaga sp.]MDP3812057.1 helix-turn-helix domain-containing protein [Hydrogenophaga sp.]
MNALLQPDLPSRERALWGLRKVCAGRVLFAQGERFKGLYAVRSGTLKSVFALADGREQVCAFPMTGDVIGLDGVVDGAHGTTMTALEDTHVALMAWRSWAQMAACDADPLQHVIELMARDIQRGHMFHALLGRANAQERLAMFLLDQSRRWNAQGCSPCDFQLRMSRAEIGSFLCMSMETVSRTFSGMQRKGWLRVDKRRIILADVGGFSRRFGALP